MITLKSSTYASIATIIFLKYRNKMSKSIESVIRTTDKLCKDLKLTNDLSHMTKYRVISYLIEAGIISTVKTKKNKKLHLSEKIINFLKNE